MTSVATGYDSKAWETMTYFYDTQAWLPKNVTLMNKAAFDRLDKPTQDALLKAAAAAETRGWRMSQDKHKWYGEQLAAHGLKVLSPSEDLKTGLQQIGERLTGEWLTKGGADVQAVIDAYKRLGTYRAAADREPASPKLAGARRFFRRAPLKRISRPVSRV